MEDFGSQIKDRVILCIWVAAMLLAVVKYVFISCRRNSEIAPFERTPSEKKTAAAKAAQEELYKKLHETVMPYTKTIPLEETESSGDVEEGAIPTEDEAIERMHQPRMHSNACAICLEEFEEEEEVTHSIGTKECPHVFHEACMKEVIVAALKKNIHCIPCPCCRQPFVGTEIQARGQETDV